MMIVGADLRVCPYYVSAHIWFVPTIVLSPQILIVITNNIKS